MVHTVVIACKQSEKLMDSITKRHGNHVRQEEYELEGGGERIRTILDTIARVEESLHSVPFERYEQLLSAVSGVLGIENGEPAMMYQAVSGVVTNVNTAREENSSFSQFLRENCEFGRDYAAYTAALLDRHNSDSSRPKLTDKSLKKLMAAKNFDTKTDVRVAGGSRQKGYVGLRLKSSAQFVEDEQNEE